MSALPAIPRLLVQATEAVHALERLALVIEYAVLLHIKTQANLSIGMTQRIVELEAELWTSS